MLKKHLFFSFLLVPLFIIAQPINYNFNSYSTENGLPTNSLLHVTSDSYGFLWLATFDGLYRWDGYSYKHYKHEEKNSGSLDNNIVYSLYEDSHRRLWVATIDGLNLYDRSSDAFIRCDINPDDKKVPVNAILEDRLHKLWLGTSDGLCLYNPDNKKSEWLTDSPEVDLIFCMATDSDNNLWLGTFNNGLKKFSQATRQFKSFRHDSHNPLSISSDKIRSILAASDHTIWVGTEDRGIVILSENGNIIKKLDNITRTKFSNQGAINCIYEDKNKSIWIGVRKESVYSIKLGDVTPIALENTSLNSNHEKLHSILSICEDQFGNTWFASSNYGLYYTNASKNLFGNYLYTPSKGLSPRVVSCFYEDKVGMIWVGTNGSGILKFDPAKNSISPVIPQLADVIIYDIKGDKEGNLWIATWGKGLIKFNPLTGAMSSFEHDPLKLNSLIFNDLKTVLPDDTLIWIGTHGEGLATLDLKTNGFIHYRNNSRFAMAMHDPGWINHLFKDSKKRLWVSSYSGLFVYDNDKLIHFEHSADSSSISSNSINMVTEGQDGHIWIVSEAGLDRYHEASGKFIRYTSKYKLPESMKSIVTSGDGLLWISSISGIFSFNPQNNLVKGYDVNDGLLDNAFFQKAVFRSRNGKLYFGTPKGFSVFDPVTLKEPIIPSYFYFTDLYVNNEQQQPGTKGSPLKRMLACTDTVKLTPEQSIFSIEFKAVNLYAPQRTRYSYKLDGLHDQWIDANGDRKVFFMNLSPGQYLLRVRYTDINGRWLDSPKALLIVILPSVWQTWWFKLCLILLLISSIVVFFYMRVSSIRKRNSQLTKEVERRTNELNTVNASLVEQNDEIKTQKETLEVSNDEIRRQTEKILTQQQHITSQNQELENTVEELRSLNKTKDHFFSILAHDLKNPVWALTEITDFIRTNFQKISRKEFENYLEGIHKSSASVYDLLVNLLHWSRTQVNKVTANPSIWGLAELVEKNRGLLEPQLKKKLIKLESHISPAHQIRADYDMIDVVIRNIISNSIKFTEYNGKIEIHSAEKDNSIILRITDSGVGMKPEQLEGLFKIDKTMVSAGTAGEKGTGLGLVISKEFIENNNGNVWVESTPGKGTSFYIQLPAVSPSSLLDDSPSNEKLPFYTKLKLDLWDTLPIEKLLKIKGKKILIADDNAEVRNYLKIIISDTFEIFEAADGKEALKIATEFVPAVAITDVLMPDMNGLEFCKALKSQTATSHIPIIILTSQWEESMQVSGYEAGADVYLTKPVKKELLIQIILNLIQNQEKLRERIFEKLLSDNSVHSESTFINKLDETFLNKLITVVEQNIADSNLDAKLICKEMATSRTVLYAKLKALTGQTVHEFIKIIRLRKSIRLLLEGTSSVSQIAYEVGFNSHSYFDKCFTKQYKMGPKEYVNKRKGAIS